MGKLFFAALFLFSSMGLGMEPQNRRTTLLLDHENNEIRILTGGTDSKAGSFDNRAFFDIHKGESVNICLINFNPLIYEFKWKGISRTLTNNYQAIQEYTNISKEAAAYFKNIKAAESGRSAGRSGLKDEEKKNEDDADKKIKEILGDVSETFFDNLSTSLNNLAAISDNDNIHRLISLSLTDKHKLYDEVSGYQIASKIKSTQDALKKIDQAELKIVTKYSEWSRNTALAKRITEISNILLLFHDQQQNIIKLCEELQVFSDNVAAIFDKKLVGTIEYSKTEDIKAEFGITLVKGLNLKNAENRPLGNFELTFSPHSVFQITLGAVGAYSFVKTTDSEGKEKKLGWNMFPAITIIPRLWEDPSLELGFQLGASLKDSYPTFIFGLSVYFYETIFIGGGLHIQFFKDEASKAGPYLALGWQPTKK